MGLKWHAWCTERQQQNRERDAKLFGPGNASSAPAATACQVSVIDDSHDKTDGKLSHHIIREMLSVGWIFDLRHLHSVSSLSKQLVYKSR